MKIDTRAMLRISSIQNQKGQRVGHHLVDASHDTPERQNQNSKEQTKNELMKREQERQATDSEVPLAGSSSLLNITA